MKLKKIKKNIAKLSLEKQIKLANWVDKFIKDAQNNPALAGKVEQETTESI